MFLGSNGKGSNKVHFEAIWSIFEHGLDSLTMEQRGWTKVKTRRARKGYKSGGRSPNAMKIRKKQETRNLIQPYPTLSNLILSYPILETLSYPNSNIILFYPIQIRLGLKPS